MAGLAVDTTVESLADFHQTLHEISVAGLAVDTQVESWADFHQTLQE